MNFLCWCNVLRWIYDVCDVTLSSNITMFVMLHRLRVTSQTTMKQSSFIDWSTIKRCKSEAWAARVNQHVQSFFKSFRMSACRFYYSFGIAGELLRLWHLLYNKTLIYWDLGKISVLCAHSTCWDHKTRCFPQSTHNRMINSKILTAFWKIREFFVRELTRETPL